MVPSTGATVVVPPVSAFPPRLAAADPGGSLPVVGVLVALALASIHLFVGRLCSVGGEPRSRVLSISGGTAVAYVFVHVLPELEHTRGVTGTDALAFVETHVYYLTLLGFLAYYGLEQFVKRSGDAERDETPSTGVFWVHVGAFGLYNALIGYLLFHPEAPGVGGVVPFAVAMILHFLVNDHGLRTQHKDVYRRVGRWVLAGAVLVGAVAGATTHLDRRLLGALFAFLAGAIVLNVIKEELPTERESAFWAFALGAVGYAGLLLFA